MTHNTPTISATSLFRDEKTEIPPNSHDEPSSRDLRTHVAATKILFSPALVDPYFEEENKFNEPFHYEPLNYPCDIQLDNLDDPDYTKKLDEFVSDNEMWNFFDTREPILTNVYLASPWPKEPVDRPTSPEYEKMEVGAEQNGNSIFAEDEEVLEKTKQIEVRKEKQEQYRTLSKNRKNKILKQADQIKSNKKSNLPISAEDRKILDAAEKIEAQREMSARRMRFYRAFKKNYENKIFEDADQIKANKERGLPISEEDLRLLDAAKQVKARREKEYRRVSLYKASRKDRENEILRAADQITANKERGLPVSEEDRKILDEAKQVEAQKEKEKKRKKACWASKKDRDFQHQKKLDETHIQPIFRNETTDCISHAALSRSSLNEPDAQQISNNNDLLGTLRENGPFSENDKREESTSSSFAINKREKHTSVEESFFLDDPIFSLFPERAGTADQPFLSFEKISASSQFEDRANLIYAEENIENPAESSLTSENAFYHEDHDLLEKRKRKPEGTYPTSVQSLKRRKTTSISLDISPEDLAFYTIPTNQSPV